MVHLLFDQIKSLYKWFNNKTFHRDAITKKRSFIETVAPVIWNQHFNATMINSAVIKIQSV